MTQTTINLSNSIRTQYIEEYQKGADTARVYDQLAKPIGKDMGRLEKGSSVQVEYLSDLQPREQSISETADVTTQTMRDGTASLTWQSRADGVTFSEILAFQNFTDYEAAALRKVGKNMMQTVEILAKNAALTGTHVERAAARAALDAGTAGHRLTESVLIKLDAILQDLMVPTYVNPNGFEQWMAIMAPAAYHDLRQSGNVIEVAKYQSGNNVLKWELGSLGRFKLISTAWAKTFGAAGADNATNVATTLSTAANALDKTIVTAGDVSANIAAGRIWTIGTEETGNTHYATNEFVRVVSASTTTLTIVGAGENGGLLYDHPAGTPVRNADNVYPVVFGGPESMAKLYHTGTGEYGEVLDPEIIGAAKQWTRIVWKYYGNYGLLAQNGILRGEFASSLDA